MQLRSSCRAAADLRRLWQEQPQQLLPRWWHRHWAFRFLRCRLRHSSLLKGPFQDLRQSRLSSNLLSRHLLGRLLWWRPYPQEIQRRSLNGPTCPSCPSRRLLCRLPSTATRPHNLQQPQRRLQLNWQLQQPLLPLLLLPPSPPL